MTAADEKVQKRVWKLKNEGLNSMQVAETLRLPLARANKLYVRMQPHEQWI